MGDAIMYSAYFNNENVANSISYIGLFWKMRKIKCPIGTNVRIEQNRIILNYVKKEEKQSNKNKKSEDFIN